MGPSDITLSHGFSPEIHPVDRLELTARIARSYELSSREFAGHGGSMWSSFNAKQAPVIEAFSRNDLHAATKYLSDPSSTDFFWGYDDLLKTLVDHRLAHPHEHPANTRKLYDALRNVLVAMGVSRCPYPEAGQVAEFPTVEELLGGIDRALGYPIGFPTPFRMEFGLATGRGVIGDRALQAFYQAWRLKQVADVVGGGKILEIGAGLGRTAYFARQLGLTDYTVVDIPATQIAQGYYLGVVCGEASLSLHGEAADRDIKLRSPKWLAESTEPFDIVLNVDSLVELDPTIAQDYVLMARDRARAFLSVNHEFNPTRVSELLKQAGMKAISRSPYWPRAGYVEELVINSIGNASVVDGQLTRPG